LLLIFEFSPIKNPFELPINTFQNQWSCLILWLNYTSCVHHTSSYNNCPHTNSIDNWSMWVPNETTRVWKHGGKLPKNMNVESS
jgi:hypothetical protein